jgi:hypothetical protein
MNITNKDNDFIKSKYLSNRKVSTLENNSRSPYGNTNNNFSH